MRVILFSARCNELKCRLKEANAACKSWGGFSGTPKPQHLGPRWFALSQLLSPQSLLFLNEQDHNKQAFLTRGQAGSWLCGCSFCCEIYTPVLKQCFSMSAGYSWTMDSTWLQTACSCLTCVRCVLFTLPASVYSQAAERIQELLCRL